MIYTTRIFLASIHHQVPKLVFDCFLGWEELLLTECVSQDQEVVELLLMHVKSRLEVSSLQGLLNFSAFFYVIPPFLDAVDILIDFSTELT
jgi:hypothetical protein